MARKSFVIQLEDIAKQPILKEYLLAHGAFKKHYDGWDHTMGPSTPPTVPQSGFMPCGYSG